MTHSHHERDNASRPGVNVPNKLCQRNLLQVLDHGVDKLWRHEGEGSVDGDVVAMSLHVLKAATDSEIT